MQGGKPLPRTGAAPAKGPEFGDEGEASEESEEATEEDSEEVPSAEPAKKETPARPPPPPFKISTFILVFLFFLGFWMIISSDARDQIALGIGTLLYPTFGFSGHYPLLTMFLIAVLQMTISAIAYNYTTDWVESAKVQHHAKAIRPLQMAALRSGKKHHQEALKPHMNDLNTRQTKMMLGQLKGMAVTWFILIAIYTWIGFFLAAPGYLPTGQPVYATPTNSSIATVNPHIVMFGVSNVNLDSNIVGPIQLWFLVFSLYTLPMNLLIRRILKHQTLAKRLESIANETGTEPAPLAPA